MYDILHFFFSLEDILNTCKRDKISVKSHLSLTLSYEKNFIKDF